MRSLLHNLHQCLLHNRRVSRRVPPDNPHQILRESPQINPVVNLLDNLQVSHQRSPRVNPQIQRDNQHANQAENRVRSLRGYQPDYLAANQALNLARNLLRYQVIPLHPYPHMPLRLMFRKLSYGKLIAHR